MAYADAVRARGRASRPFVRRRGAKADIAPVASPAARRAGVRGARGARLPFLQRSPAV
jgi:hypothetical protein